MRFSNISPSDMMGLSYTEQEAQRLAPRGLRKFPCISLPVVNDPQGEVCVSTENQLSPKAQRKAVKRLAAGIDAAISEWNTGNPEVPFESRRSEYQQALLRNHGPLQRLREIGLSPEPPAYSLSRAVKNKAAIAVGVVGKVGAVATVGAAAVTTVAVIACSPVTAVLGGIAGAVAGPFLPEDYKFLRMEVDLSGPCSYVAASIGGAAMGIMAGGVGTSMILLQIALTDGQEARRMSRKAKNMLSFLNYMPEARHYVNRPRLSTEKIADSAYEKLHDALCDIGPRMPGNEAPAEPSTAGETMVTSRQ